MGKNVLCFLEKVSQFGKEGYALLDLFEELVEKPSIHFLEKGCFALGLLKNGGGAVRLWIENDNIELSLHNRDGDTTYSIQLWYERGSLSTVVVGGIPPPEAKILKKYGLRI